MLKIKDGLPVTLYLQVSLRDLPYIVSYEKSLLNSIFIHFSMQNRKISF